MWRLNWMGIIYILKDKPKLRLNISRRIFHYRQWCKTINKLRRPPCTKNMAELDIQGTFTIIQFMIDSFMDANDTYLTKEHKELPMNPDMQQINWILKISTSWCNNNKQIYKTWHSTQLIGIHRAPFTSDWESPKRLHRCIFTPTTQQSTKKQRDTEWLQNNYKIITSSRRKK